MDKRDKALEELKNQIKKQREELDPRLLEMAERALGLKEEKTVPYDKEAAAKAVALFLKNHDDAEGFQKKLLEMMGKKQQ